MQGASDIRAETWPRVSALYDAYDDIAANDVAARDAFLRELRNREPDVATELEALLAAIARSQGVSPKAGLTANPTATAFDDLLSAALDETETTLKSGQRFGPWTTTRRVGTGGMGEVWHAERNDGLYAASVAIKVLRSDVSALTLASRFARERAVLARLDHPNITRLLDAGVANGQAFLVLEFVDGTPLVNYVDASAHTVASRVRLIRDIARAVEHAHSQLVLHRDLKPSNVLVTPSGAVKLLDFGIAAALDEVTSAPLSNSATQLGGRGLTLEYAAPEQVLGEPTVAASDVYSLGVMLFQLLTGERPFAPASSHSAGAQRAALEYAVVHTEAPRASVVTTASIATLENKRQVKLRSNQNGGFTPPTDHRNINGDLDAIIAKALRKSPSERYLTATAFAADLDAWLAQMPISVRAEDRSYRARLWFRRNWKLAAVATFALVAVLAGLGLSLWQRNIAVAEAARANKVADYLGGLIQSASPDNHHGQWPTVATLLEQSEKDLDTQFENDPKTRAILLRKLADTNDALQRDTTALKQVESLIQLLLTGRALDTPALVNARRQQADLLIRLQRNDAALKIIDNTLPVCRQQYGDVSDACAALLNARSSTLSNLGRYTDAQAALDAASTVLRKLHPNDVVQRVEIANRTAQLLARRGMWRDALATLAAVELDFPDYALRNSKAPRELLEMRITLESMRVRLGQYEGARERLIALKQEARALLGPNNKRENEAHVLMAVLACETGRYVECLELSREGLISLRLQRGIEPSEIIVKELSVLGLEIWVGQVSAERAAAQLEEALVAIPAALPTPSVHRSHLYRTSAAVAARAGLVAIGQRALALARSDLAAANVKEPERIAQVDRAAALVAFISGDPKRAVELLGERFRVFARVNEGDTPRQAALWLQKALFELEFDATAARQSLAKSQDIYARAGGAQPQFRALATYAAARLSADAVLLRNAEDGVDRAYSRQRTEPWRAPFLPSQ